MIKPKPPKQPFYNGDPCPLPAEEVSDMYGRDFNPGATEHRETKGTTPTDLSFGTTSEYAMRLLKIGRR